MTHRMSRPSKSPRITFYWPHVGIAVGLVLNGVALALGNSELIGTASNILAFCAFRLAQRRRKDDG